MMNGLGTFFITLAYEANQHQRESHHMKIRAGCMLATKTNMKCQWRDQEYSYLYKLVSCENFLER